MAVKQSAVKAEEQSFEGAIERLEQIVDEMEAQKLTLADLLTRYEEGTRLVRTCEEKLKAAEKRIELITRNSQGEIELREFEPEDSVPPSQTIPKSSVEGREDVSLF